MASDSKKVTAGEFLKSLEADEVYQARRKKREEEDARRLAEWSRAQAPLLADLSAVGIVGITSVWDLVPRREPYPEAIPILFEHLSRKYDSQNGVKWAIGCILAAIAKKSHIEEVATLIRDRSHGSHRLILVTALGKLGGPIARDALEDVRDDPDVYKEVEVALRRLNKRAPKTSGNPQS